MVICTHWVGFTPSLQLCPSPLMAMLWLGERQRDNSVLRVFWQAHEASRRPTQAPRECRSLTAPLSNPLPVQIDNLIAYRMHRSSSSWLHPCFSHTCPWSLCLIRLSILCALLMTLKGTGLSGAQQRVISQAVCIACFALGSVCSPLPC